MTRQLPYARVYYSAAYYDAANRLIAAVNAGTNGGDEWTLPGSIPESSATLLVTLYTYNDAGLLDTTIDPRGLVTKTEQDALGRTREVITDYTDGTPTNSSNQITQYGYDGDNNQTYIKVVLPDDALQETLYVYGVTTDVSAINSNDILATVEYPDPTTGEPSTSLEETYTVNALGQNVTFTDRNGTIHTYSYDVLGRQTSDTVTTLADGVDDSIQRIDTAYDALGNPYLVTSYNDTSGETIANQVMDVYNGLDQLTQEYQEQAGAVDIESTLSVQYAYTDLTEGNNSRLVSITYPNGREIDYNYAEGLNDSISRISSISDGEVTLEALTYLGLGTVVVRAYPQADTALTYIQQDGDDAANTDGGDKYTGLDRFGNVIDQFWINTSTGDPQSRVQYAYDQDGNVLYANNLVNSAFSQLYTYDNLNQLATYKQGTLSASEEDGPLDTVSSPNDSQSFTTDAVGNFTSVTTGETTQTREANADNQITSVCDATTPVYDNNGNLITDENGQHYVYDAWNRLANVKDSEETIIAIYVYDGLRRRIQQTESSVTTDIYFNSSWQAIEERVSGSATVQYVWSAAGGDILVERDRDIGHDDSWAERVYVMQDPRTSVIGLVDTSADVLERYAYRPFGQIRYLSYDWSSIGSSAYATAYLFQAARLDNVTGVYNFRNRDLSPSLQTWIEQDPLSYSAGDVNLHRFVSNNPGNFSDPSGLDVVDRPRGPQPFGPAPLPVTDNPDITDDVNIIVVIVVGDSDERSRWTGTARDVFGSDAFIYNDVYNVGDLINTLNQFPPGSISDLIIGGHGTYAGAVGVQPTNNNTIRPPGAGSINSDTITRDFAGQVARSLAPNAWMQFQSCGGSKTGDPTRTVVGTQHNDLQIFWGAESGLRLELQAVGTTLTAGVSVIHNDLDSLKNCCIASDNAAKKGDQRNVNNLTIFLLLA